MNSGSRDRELEKQLDAYVKGNLTENEAEEVWEKLLIRPDYIELLETELVLKAIFEERAAQSAESDDKHVTAEEPGGFPYILRHTWRWAAAAAVLLMLVISISLFQGPEDPTLQDLAVMEINITENLITAPVVRSDTQKQSSVDSMLNYGYQLAVTGDLENAIAVYKGIVERFGGTTTSANAYLNMGIIQYNKGMFEEAVSSFSMAVNSKSLDQTAEERANWYLGNAYIHLQDLQRAQEMFKKVYEMNNLYRDSAGKMLDSIEREKTESPG